MLTPVQQANLELAAAAAVAGERQTQLPAELTVPQYADESGWGAHCPGNNPFGIKAVAGVAGQELQTTEYLHSSQSPITEGQAFEVFPTLTDAFVRHAQLITAAKPYAAAWAQYIKDKQIHPFIERVAKVYATDPMYGTKLLRILAMPEVRAAIATARQPLVTITQEPVKA
jgi:flagellar protein FlgJ